MKSTASTWWRWQSSKLLRDPRIPLSAEDVAACTRCDNAYRNGTRPSPLDTRRVDNAYKRLIALTS